MMRMDLAEAVKAKNPRRLSRLRPRTLRAIGPSLAGELQLQRVLIGVLRSGAVLARSRGLPEAVNLSEQMSQLTDARYQADDAIGLGYFAQTLRDLFERQIQGGAEKIREIFGDEEQRHRVGLETTVKANYGIDISSVLRATDVRVAIETAMLRTLSLAKGITDDLSKKLVTTLVQGASDGERSTTLAKRMTKEFGIAAKRAKLIARDQTATLNGTLNKVRQQQIGLEKYKWSTSLDERVRPEHAEREGKIFSWDNPPDDGNPGEPINCRCVAIAIIPGLEDIPYNDSSFRISPSHRR
jgi:SPP1 gp7 family putative phage head morphogenesis protein